MVSIDAVYQKVLALANKEQRGYITPQEFNLFADHAQMEIFEQYFYDLNQFKRLPGNSTGHSDMATNLEEKISFFERYDRVAEVTGQYGNVSLSDFSRFYRLQMVRVDYETNSGFVVAEEIQLNELQKYGTSPLGKWNKKRPVYTRYTNSMKVYPYPGLSASSNDFELHASEETELVYRILALFGIAIEKPQLTQIAAGLQGSQIQQEKQ